MDSSSHVGQYEQHEVLFRSMTTQLWTAADIVCTEDAADHAWLFVSAFALVRF